MILQIDDWKFDIDMARTMEYSAAEAAEHCECGYCRNFYAAMDQYLPQLRPMLAQFGIDAEAPDMLCPYDIHEGRMWYEGEYAVFGNILQAGKLPLNHSGADVFILEPTLDDDYHLPQPLFLLKLESAELPWILDEPMEEVLSPANEPSFLKKMWDRLLGKGPRSDIPV